MDRIVIKGAREHKLKNIDIEIPRGQLVVITGLSGSGKSSLAFDTIYAEGQRRYVESQYVMLAVSDSGKGMSKEVIENAFEPFFTTKPVGVGKTSRFFSRAPPPVR